MKTIMMNEVEKEQFDKMFSNVEEIKKALLGDQFRKVGIIKQMEELEDTFHSHDKEDKENFGKLFEFQKKQTLFVGWTGAVVRFVFASLAVLGGWLIAILSK